MFHALGQDDQAIRQYSSAEVALLGHGGLDSNPFLGGQGANGRLFTGRKDQTQLWQQIMREIAPGCKEYRNALCWAKP
jgi:hypothetical protein